MEETNSIGVLIRILNVELQIGGKILEALTSLYWML